MTRRIDTLVIGAGAVGVCCAFSLANSGLRVSVVDQGEIGAGCSHGNAGLISASHITPLATSGALLKGLKWMFDPESPFYIKPRLNLSLLMWLCRFGAACRGTTVRRGMALLRELSQASLSLYEELAGLEALHFFFRHKGSLRIFRDHHSFEASLRETRLLEPYGLTFQVLDQTAVRRLEPMVQPGVIGGLYSAKDGHLNPSQFVHGLAELAANRGVSFLTSTEVFGFGTSGKTITTVKTTHGEFSPDNIVLTAGSWSARLAAQLGLHLPVQPAKGYSVTVKCPERNDAIPLWLSETKVIATPMGETLRLAGTLELAGLDLSINHRRVEAIWRAAREYLVGIDAYEVLETWRGLRPCAPDGLPIIGRSDKWGNLIIATGHGTLGMTLAPITGRLVAQLLSGEPTCVDVTGLDPRRFR